MLTLDVMMGDKTTILLALALAIWAFHRTFAIA
jgi:hypothetical protein